jgi:hypothetical protein
MRQDGLPVLEFDREGRTRKDLADRPEQLQRSLLGRFRDGPRARGVLERAAAGYGRLSLLTVIALKSTRFR